MKRQDSVAPPIAGVLLGLRAAIGKARGQLEKHVGTFIFGKKVQTGPELGSTSKEADLNPNR